MIAFSSYSTLGKQNTSPTIDIGTESTTVVEPLHKEKNTVLVYLVE